MLSLSRKDSLSLVIFAAIVLTMPIWLAPLGAAYPGLMQKFAIYAIFAIGFNILFGLTGYLSFGHAAFLGVGSYTTIWSFKLLTMDILPAMVFAVVVSGLFALLIGYFSLRRSGIYFSILTLAFAQMCYSLAYSVLTPITNGETGLLLARGDPRYIDQIFGAQANVAGLPQPTLLGSYLGGYGGFYLCAVILVLTFYVSQKIFASPFGMALRGIKSNQTRMNYTGFNTKPYTLAAFVISGMFAGLAGALLSITDPLAGAERMRWTESGNDQVFREHLLGHQHQQAQQFLLLPARRGPVLRRDGGVEIRRRGLAPDARPVVRADRRLPARRPGRRLPEARRPLWRATAGKGQVDIRAAG
jgi:ABC-type branched-subunit amino acid transport system permease subunit